MRGRWQPYGPYGPCGPLWTLMGFHALMGPYGPFGPFVDPLLLCQPVASLAIRCFVDNPLPLRLSATTPLRLSSRHHVCEGPTVVYPSAK